MLLEKEKIYRNELKYVCTEGELVQIRARIRPFCKSDPHVSGEGIYGIRSIYFDDRDNSCFFENENGTDPREKFRIRIYNGDSSIIFLECKRKEKNMTHKEQTLITKDKCDNILQGNFSPDEGNDKLLSKFYLQYKERNLRPKVIVSYEREPYVYAAGNVRITLDRNIGGSIKIEDFYKERLPVRPVMPPGQHILEVKYDRFLPDFLYQMMSLNNLRQTAYSKYYYCRRFTV